MSIVGLISVMQSTNRIICGISVTTKLLSDPPCLLAHITCIIKLLWILEYISYLGVIVNYKCMCKTNFNILLLRLFLITS